MSIRRVVTGLNPDGVSSVIADGAPRNHHDMQSAPGFSRSILWTSPSPAVVPVDGDDTPTRVDLHPKPGETIGMLLTLPPDSMFQSADFDHAAFAQEGLAHNAGIFERMEPDHPGMHTTDTIDYVIVIEGEVWLETGDGEQTRIATGDVVIQTGTRHAWRNRSDKPVRMFSVLVGARRRA